MTIGSTVFLVDDDEGYRFFLRELLISTKYKVQDFASAQDFLQGAVVRGAGCVILDLLLPEMDGLEVLQQLKRRRLELPVIMISAHGEIATAVRSMQMGAVNFLQKPIKQQEFLECVRAALRQSQAFQEEFGDLQGVAERLGYITPRERHVMERIIAGKANKTIAWELGTSVRTIEAHRANLMRKLQVRSVAELTRLTLAVRGNLLPGASVDGTLIPDLEPWAGCTSPAQPVIRSDLQPSPPGKDQRLATSGTGVGFPSVSGIRR